jgi:hypothetical protein
MESAIDKHLRCPRTLSPLMRHAMHRHTSQRLADSSWLLQRRDLAPEESAYWLIEWGVMHLMQTADRQARPATGALTPTRRPERK